METIWSAVVAVGLNWVIGDGEEMPWRLSEDLKRFKRLTMGKPMIMGRKTHESIGRALPGRRNIVLSRRQGWAPAPGCELAEGLEAAELLCQGEPEVCVIGGAGVYDSFLDRLDVLHLSIVLGEFDGGVCFPALSRDGWRVVSRELFDADEKNEYPHVYVVLERVKQEASRAPNGCVPRAWYEGRVVSSVELGEE